MAICVCKLHAIASVQVQPAHVVAEPLQQGQPAYDTVTAAATAGILPEELYPTSDVFVGNNSAVDELALLQQLTTQQKLAAVQQLMQWLLANQAEVRESDASRASQQCV